MKIVINTQFGGFSVPKAICDILNCDCYDDTIEIRTNADFIKYVESAEYFGSLGVAEIPTEATDWEISEYDGCEHIIAVVDGKLCHIYEKC